MEETQSIREIPETTETTATETVESPNWLELLHEAEEKAYRKGFEDAARKAVAEARSVWSAPVPPQEPDLDTGAGFLKCMRPGVWDD